MTTDKFDPVALLEHAIDFGKSVILDQDDEITPQAIIYGFDKDGLKIAVLMLVLDKAYWPEAIGQAMKGFGGFSYILLTEAWMSIPTGDVSKDSATFAAMEHSSLRDLDVPKREVLMAQYSGPGGPLMLSVEIKLGRKNFGEPMMMGDEGTEISGRMVDIGEVSSTSEKHDA